MIHLVFKPEAPGLSPGAPITQLGCEVLLGACLSLPSGIGWDFLRPCRKLFVSLRMCSRVLPLETTIYFLSFLLFTLMCRAGGGNRIMQLLPIRCVQRPRKTKASLGRGFQDLSISGGKPQALALPTHSPHLFSSPLVDLGWRLALRVP